MEDKNALQRRPLPERLVDLWATWLKGQFLMSCIMGGLTWIVGSAIGLAYAGVLGMVAGVMDTVPTLGPLIAIVPAAIVALSKGSAVIAVQNHVFALIVIGAYLIIQQVGALLIQPRLMGKRLDLPPLLVLVAVLAGALVGNVIGAILAVPLIATLRELLDSAAHRKQ